MAEAILAAGFLAVYAWNYYTESRILRILAGAWCGLYRLYEFTRTEQGKVRHGGTQARIHKRRRARSRR